MRTGWPFLAEMPPDYWALPREVRRAKSGFFLQPSKFSLSGCPPMRHARCTVLRTFRCSFQVSLLLLPPYVSTPSRPSWFDAPTVIGVAGAALQIYQWAGARPLWLDEEMIAVNLRDRTFAELTGTLWLAQSAPLGWLFVQRAVLITLGMRELALRLVPVLFGVATVA